MPITLRVVHEAGGNQSVNTGTAGPFASPSAVLALTSAGAVASYATRRSNGASAVDSFREAFGPFFMYADDYSELNRAAATYEAALNVAVFAANTAQSNAYKAARTGGASRLSAFTTVFGPSYSPLQTYIDFAVAAALLDAALGVTSPT